MLYNIDSMKECGLFDISEIENLPNSMMLKYYKKVIIYRFGANEEIQRCILIGDEIIHGFTRYELNNVYSLWYQLDLKLDEKIKANEFLRQPEYCPKYW